jgi:hypothetical protein
LENQSLFNTFLSFSMFSFAGKHNCLILPVPFHILLWGCRYLCSFESIFAGVGFVFYNRFFDYKPAPGSTSISPVRRGRPILIRYILFKLENQDAEKDYDYEDGKATLEHILPENAPQEWESSFKPEDQEMYVYRLGNYTLIEEKKNKYCGTKLFEEKKKIYKTSAYKLTNERSLYDEWTPETLRKRQEQLANIALTAWKISY